MERINPCPERERGDVLSPAEGNGLAATWGTQSVVEYQEETRSHDCRRNKTSPDGVVKRGKGNPRPIGPRAGSTNIDARARLVARLGDAMLAARSADIHDVGYCVLRLLVGAKEQGMAFWLPADADSL